MDRSACWRIDSPPSLAWREWDGEAVIYDGRTGSTHFLGAAPASVWRTLRDAGRPLRAVELAAKVDFGDSAGGMAAGEIVADVIAELERLGLIRAECP